MALWNKKSETAADALPYVRDISTAVCVFCPYGTHAAVGDRMYIYDEQTVLGHQQRERLVEILAVKVFHSTGRMLSLDLAMLPIAEAARIAADSELTVDALLEHRHGASTYDSKRRPVVVYFKPCDVDDTTGSHTQPKAAINLGSLPQAKHVSGLRRLGARLFSRHDS
jgi:hypothetical protein